MYIDDISFKDISIFNLDENQSIFSKLNFAKTAGGKDTLKHWFQNPFHNLDRIKGTQQIIQAIYHNLGIWPEEISNGTIVVMGKYLDYQVDTINKKPGVFSAFSYRILHSADYAVIKFSVEHFIRFTHGLQKICNIFKDASIPDFAQHKIDSIQRRIAQPYFQTLLKTNIDTKFTRQKLLTHARLIRYEHRSDFNFLIDLFLS